MGGVALGRLGAFEMTARRPESRTLGDADRVPVGDVAEAVTLGFPVAEGHHS